MRLALLALLLIAPFAAAEYGSIARYGGDDCSIVRAVHVAPFAAPLLERVPAGIEPVVAGAVPVLLGSGVRCEWIRPSVYADVGLLVEAPDGSEGVHGYLLKRVGLAGTGELFEDHLPARVADYDASAYDEPYLPGMAYTMVAFLEDATTGVPDTQVMVVSAEAARDRAIVPVTDLTTVTWWYQNEEHGLLRVRETSPVVESREEGAGSVLGELDGVVYGGPVDGYGGHGVRYTGQLRAWLEARVD